ncbi:HPF/RaiA family ribosome-associated protein [Tenacibaculum sp. TC6]|uniref:HPF/RaiA family ribosome-associated protein n=1 Tax=Tenacibaculum sp. TC6 TaxID=3423223 RepID=UPI003D366153
MHITFDYINIENTNAQLEKFSLIKLQHLLIKYPFVKKTDIFFKIDTDNLNEKYCGIRISTPASRILAYSNENEFEAAIYKTINKLDIILTSAC